MDEMKVLAINVDETGVRLLISGQNTPRTFLVPGLTPRRMVTEVRKIVADNKYDVVSIGYPGLVLQNRPLTEAGNLGRGWVGFDFKAGFHCPVKIVSGAVMQALGNYRGGRMLYLRLATDFGSAMVVNGTPIAMELGCLPYRKASLADYASTSGIKRLGKKKWRRHVALAVARLMAALHPDDVVLGGRNVRSLKQLPAGCRTGDDADVLIGGFRLWDNINDQRSTALPFLPQYSGKRKDNGHGISHATRDEAPAY